MSDSRPELAGSVPDRSATVGTISLKAVGHAVEILEGQEEFVAGWTFLQRNNGAQRGQAPARVAGS